MSASRNPPASPSVLSIPFDRRSRRDSVGSMSVSSHVDKEQLAQALDKIHTSASQSDVLTTFNDFGSPPTAVPVAETKGSAGDMVQQGLSGFYSRLKEAVVGGKAASSVTSDPAGDDGADGQEAVPSLSTKTTAGSHSHASAHTRSKSSVSSVPRGEHSCGGTTNPNSAFSSNLSSDLPTTVTSSSGGTTSESHSQMPISSKASSLTTMSTQKSSQKPSSTSQGLPKLGRAEASAAVVDTSGGTGVFDMPRDNGKQTTAFPDLPLGSGLDGGYENVPIPPAGPSTSSRQSRDDAKIPAVIDRLSIAGSMGGKRSPSVATDAGTAETNSINTSAHNSVYHESFAHDERPQQLQSGQMRIPGTTTNEGAPEMVNARLENMRKQIQSKEFWMADETCKECFRCGDPFSAFRRKHHCRTCGWIFDGKCTSTISGSKFGVSGNLRVCKNCLDIINRRYDSGSEESDDPRLTTLLRTNTTSSKLPPQASSSRSKGDGDSSILERIEDAEDDTRSTTTPMMAIPATRRKGDPSNRNSAILEIDAPQLSRPGSSRSLMSLNSARPPSSGHIRHHSKPNFHWTHKTPAEDRVPFRKDVSDEMGRKSKLPAFHDDNIIDPELAPYMSDESSGDEQMSIFATMAGNDTTSSSLDPDKSNFGPFLSAGRKHRTRGEKSISGLSFTSRGQDKDDGILSMANHSRVQGRHRNMSTASATAGQHHLRSPRSKPGMTFKGPSLSSEALGLFDGPTGFDSGPPGRPSSMVAKTTKQIKLSAPSLKHVKRMFRQLLNDAAIPNPAAWEKTLIPLLRRCADDVDPNTREGDRMDIRHYVKLKKIPGGKPSDSSYVSGVIFTKNLALKSMPRRISHPRILIVSFPIEYQRQQQHQFMSLEPVMSQEKEFLKMVVARIRNHQPEVVLAQRNVAGLALQSLAEAGIAVAYNVKASVIGAVSRCVGTPIISSMDMLSLPIVVGRCAEFEVKTFVNNDIPGRKKTYIFLSGCEKFLGCTIALRGTSTAQLSRMKQITEFMVYVVYSLKLESCLLNDSVMQMQLPADGSIAAAKPTATRQSTNGSLPALTSTGGENLVDRSPAASTMLLTDGESLNTSQPDSGGLLTASQSSNSVAPTPVEGVPAETAAEAASEPVAEGQPSQPEATPLETSTPSLLSLQDADAQVLHLRTSHEDVPAPTFYSDMVEKYKTKILSSSPFVKFTQPYLLVKAREQETRLMYLKKLRDQDIIEEERDDDQAAADSKGPQKQFQLINPEMVHEIGRKAPRQIMEVLHAVHDAEYDKALYAYQTMTRQWENYIQGNLDLFDPYSHQNIVVLYSLTCTETKIPCLEPGLIGIAFYEEMPDPNGPMDADCTLGQYVQDLCDGAEELCHANGCDRHMWQHHRTYVHGEARVTFFVEPEAKLPSQPELPEGHDPISEDEEDTIYMWSYCKICKRDLKVKPLSPSAWKYSFGKYLELLFWSRGLRLTDDTGCPHDCQKDHIRYFHFRGSSVRIHYDPIDLLELVVPRARITWKVDHDLKLKNDIFVKTQERWLRFIMSVKTRIKSIRIDSVLPEKEKDCRAEVERLAKKAHEEHVQVLRGLERAYMQSKHYEIIPLNATIRTMAEKIAEWDAAFTKFEADYLSDKDVRQLTVIQLRKMFTDTESKESSTTDGGGGSASASASVNGSEAKTPSTAAATTQNSFTESDEKSSPPTSQPTDSEPPAADATATTTGSMEAAEGSAAAPEGQQQGELVVPSDQVVSLDLATPISPGLTKADLAAPPAPVAAPTSAPAPAPEPESQPQKPAQEPEVVKQEPTMTTAVSESVSSLPVPTSASRSTSPSKASRATAPPLMSQQSLTEKVEQLRREFKAQSAEINEAAQSLGTNQDGPPQLQSPTKSQARPVPDPRGAGPSRKAGPIVSPPMVRASTQPVGVLPRSKHSSGSGKAIVTVDGGAGSGTDTSVGGPTKVEKKFSDRIGLTALKNHRKGGQSAIPRFVHKRDAKKVTSLTQHFEQLSREFEKERNRERRQQAAKMHHPRAYVPKSSARATVEVYDNVDQAVQEPGPTDDEHLFASQHSEARSADLNPAATAAADARSTAASPSTAGPAADKPAPTQQPTTSADAAAGADAKGKDKSQEASPTTDDSAPPSQQPSEETTEGATEEGETDDREHKDKSAAGSDDEEGGSYADQSLEDILPDVETIAEHLEPSGTVPAELQQDKKSNLMKMLSNFWAERSASGWPELEYPLRPTDHIFIDSDVIVREDEPSSLIAFALSSEDYIAKLEDIRRQGRRAARKERRNGSGAVRHGDGQADDDLEDEDDEDEDDVDDEEDGERGGDADDENEEDDQQVGDSDDDDNEGGGLVMKTVAKDQAAVAEPVVPHQAALAAKEVAANTTNGEPAITLDRTIGHSEQQQQHLAVPQADGSSAALTTTATTPLPRSEEALANPVAHALAPPPMTLDEEELERSLLRPTGTHLKYQFTEGSARMMCKIFYAEQFDALRRKCGVADRIIESLSRCLKWDSKGGKTKSVFLKTLDDRLVMKSLSPVETAAFLRFAPSYFRIMAEALFHDLPSVIAKMLGFFQVIVKNAATGTEIKLDLLIMENLFYDRQETRKFDLKGSMRNRKIQSTGEQNEVLLDENMVEYIYESPLFAREHAKKLLWASVWNDTLFLARQNVMDYSLMVAVDESRKELVVGIIDCIRTYTWDKKLESWIKDRGFAGGGRNRPTVTSPKEYKSRFREAMDRYILQAPNCWHLFGSMGYSHPALGQRARFEDE
ncbi:Mitochondrial distribution and morphology protein 12 [Sporothrix stenoceras]|uniref:1-phosphatidylinositol-3-phosphate 5-kinase n=1 Tax=Sporothrix stenoceras TaxID=5173 RepID=A0ABR3ZJB1_9PEZI